MDSLRWVGSQRKFHLIWCDYVLSLLSTLSDNAALKTGQALSIYKCNKYPEKDFDMNLNKITPLHTKDWYVKWVSSAVLIAAQLSTAMGVELFPEYPLTMVLYLVGILGWLLVAYWWHDRALMILNSIGAFIMASGIVKFYFGVL